MADSYQVKFKKSAEKELKALPKSMQDKVLEAMAVLQVNPRTELLDIRILQGHDQLYRLRIGNYRIVFEIKDEILIIFVIKIGHRKDVYRKL